MISKFRLFSSRCLEYQMSKYLDVICVGVHEIIILQISSDVDESRRKFSMLILFQVNEKKLSALWNYLKRIKVKEILIKLFRRIFIRVKKHQKWEIEDPKGKNCW